MDLIASGILEELKRTFDLKRNHTYILRLLSIEGCTADEICERTTIPKGRVYGLLNELIGMHLILRKDGVPAVYTMADPKNAVMDFLKYEFAQGVERQSKILSMLQEADPGERIEMVTSEKNYEYHSMGMISQADWVKIIHRKESVSWFLLPRDEAQVVKVREEIYKRRTLSKLPPKEISLMRYRSYMDLYASGKPVEQIMTRESFDFYISIIKDLFGEQKTRELARSVLAELGRRKNIRLFILDATPSVFNTYITDKGILSLLIFHGQVSGMKLFGNKPVELYEKYFEELKSQSVPIAEYLERLCK